MRCLALFACLVSLSAPALAQQAPARSPSAITQSEDTAIRTEALLRLVSDAQAYFLMPTAFGGGDQSFDGISLKVLEYSVDHLGRHVRTLSVRDATHTYSLTNTGGKIFITATSDRYPTTLRATVQGPTLGDIAVNF